MCQWRNPTQWTIERRLGHSGSNYIHWWIKSDTLVGSGRSVAGRGQGWTHHSFPARCAWRRPFPPRIRAPSWPPQMNSFALFRPSVMTVCLTTGPETWSQTNRHWNGDAKYILILSSGCFLCCPCDESPSNTAQVPPHPCPGCSFCLQGVCTWSPQADDVCFPT